jgi:hypothetical protein
MTPHTKRSVVVLLVPVALLAVGGCRLMVDPAHHYEPVAISGIPGPVKQAFRKSFPESEIVRTEKLVAVTSAGTNVIFYVFDFTDSNGIHQTTVDEWGRIGMEYVPADYSTNR